LVGRAGFEPATNGLKVPEPDAIVPASLGDRKSSRPVCPLSVRAIADRQRLMRIAQTLTVMDNPERYWTSSRPESDQTAFFFAPRASQTVLDEECPHLHTCTPVHREARSSVVKLIEMLSLRYQANG